MKKIIIFLCTLFCVAINFQARSNMGEEMAGEAVQQTIELGIDTIEEYLKTFEWAFANDTAKPITFRIVTEKDGCHSYSLVTLQGKRPNPEKDGQYLIDTWGFTEQTNKCPHHVDIDLSWAENAKYWTSLHNLGADKPEDDFQTPESTYWGAGSWQPWGWTFYGNPRGIFRMKGPSVKYPPFHDPNSYLTLSE